LRFQLCANFGMFGVQAEPMPEKRYLAEDEAPAAVVK
jgi:hypothetical protein